MHTFYRIELSLSFSDLMGNHNNIYQTEQNKNPSMNIRIWISVCFYNENTQLFKCDVY